MKKQLLTDHINAFGEAKGTQNHTLSVMAAQALSALLAKLPDELPTKDFALEVVEQPQAAAAPATEAPAG